MPALRTGAQPSTEAILIFKSDQTICNASLGTQSCVQLMRLENYIYIQIWMHVNNYCMIALLCLGEASAGELTWN